MRIFVSGGAKSGKSALAQALTLALAKGGKRYYLATMIPTDREDCERIRRHIADRAGMGFETIECEHSIMSCLSAVDEQGAFLVDSVTALLQNAIFPREKHYRMDLPAARRCADELVTFAQRVHNVVFVSDDIYSEPARYDEATEEYRQCLADIDRRLARVCDTVIEVFAGQYTIHKGSVPL
ncbi:MAG: bifunctional adenosylcobinamide kinase/adenosylcobinamide-phosphate guanylyltransferase [Oscillospiraceae bacterium]|nr:bifunctional adenosylcobinamide kinase/adenosylcobinamide-phosphate guanylyltransferase [Oscillospiraceae bacterium]